MRRSLVALALAVVLPSLAPAAARADVVVRPGETLSEIADRHGVSVTRLMQANGITNPNVVVAGQKLVVPGARSSTGAGRARSGSVTVQPGETLSEIADRQGVSVTQLMQANGITNPNVVVAGQKLVVPGARNTASAAAPRPLPTAPYTLKSGETLSEIADRFGTSTERLIQLNRISNPNMVIAGTRLAIPGRPSSAPAARSATAPRPPAPRNAKEHVVRSGESLSTIADSYGLPVEKLVTINKIDDPDLVVSGTRLKLQAPPPVQATVKAPAKPPAKPPAKAATQPVAQPKPKPATATAAPAAPKPVVTATAATPTPDLTPAAKPTTTIQPTPRAQPTVTPPARVTAQATTQPATSATSPAQATPATRSTAIKPSTSIAAATTGVAPTTGVAATTAVAATSKPVSTATRAATMRPSATSKASSGKPQGPDWRSYGPLQVDWANWQPMGGSYVAPTLNGDGKPVYLAVNCGARKLNATSQSGQWKSWDAPQTDFEEQLISDICKARTS